MKVVSQLSLVLLSTAALTGCKSKLSVAGKEQPNIIYIMCDDHSYQTISAYGSEVSK